MTYVVVDIGCLECGESSSVVAITDDEMHANSVAGDHVRANGGSAGTYFLTGEHYVEVFEATNADT